MSIKRIGGVLVALSLATACATAPKTLASFHSSVRHHAARTCDVRCMNQSGYGVAALSAEEQAAFKALRSKAEQRAWMATRMTAARADA